MKSKKRHSKVSRREFVSTAGSAAAAVGLGPALTACGERITEVPPEDPSVNQGVDVVFSSQWETATGAGDDARLDTSNPTENGGPFLSQKGSIHSVVSGDTYGWPYGNLLQIEQGAAPPQAG